MPSSPGYIPGPVVIPDCLEFRLRWLLPNNKIATNVLHALIGGGAPIVTSWPDDLFGAISADAGWTAYHPYLHADTKLQGIDMKDLRAANQPMLESTGAALSGTGVANALPEEVALCVSLRTGLAGRQQRGRVYLTGFDTSALAASGLAAAGLQTAALGFMVAVQNGMGTLGLQLAIATKGHAEYVSPWTGRTILAEGAGITNVLSMSIRDALFDSQRRRK